MSHSSESAEHPDSSCRWALRLETGEHAPARNSVLSLRSAPHTPDGVAAWDDCDPAWRGL